MPISKAIWYGLAGWLVALSVCVCFYVFQLMLSASVMHTLYPVVYFYGLVEADAICLHPFRGRI